MGNKRFYAVALGCPKNRVDVESLVALAEGEGYRLTDDVNEADVLLVATCGFIAEAAQESINTVLELSQLRHDGARLVVAGCLSQRYGSELAEALPEADVVVSTADLHLVVEAIAGRGPCLVVDHPASDIERVVGRRPSGSPGSAYIKVADGCSRRCAFCTIPAIRGPFQSRPINEICDEARELTRNGVKELNLVAQDLTSFGRDHRNHKGLADLLIAMSRVDGVRWIRPLYLYPEAGLDPVMQVMAELPQVVPYLDLPIQHASDSVLRRMKRGHNAHRLDEIITAARRHLRGVSLRTTVIVGHPGESAEDFEVLLRFIERARFEHLGAFRYSHEEGTASANQSGLVSKRDSYNRYRRVMALQRRVSRRSCRAIRGQTLEVLVEGQSEESPLVTVGRHAGQAPEVDGLVYLDRPAQPGSMVTVRVIDSGDYDLVGEVLK